LWGFIYRDIYAWQGNLEQDNCVSQGSLYGNDTVLYIRDVRQSYIWHNMVAIKVVRRKYNVNFA
jgi:hypothetical protein